MQIRPARLGDEAEIAELHVNSWAATHRGIVPDQMLCTITVEDRRQQWADALQDADNLIGKKITFIAVEDDHIVGFVCGGVARKDKLMDKNSFDAEMYAIFVEADMQGRGVGAELFAHFKEWLIKHNFKNMFLWTFADNPFVDFYPKMGGIKGNEERVNESLGIPLKIINYAWQNMDRE